MEANQFENQRYLSIDLTNRCDNKCIFCVVKGRDKVLKDMEFSDIRKFLEEYARKDFKSVNLHGGEPTEFERFDDLTDLINDLGYSDITIQTNGSKLNDDGFVSKMMRRNVRLFVVSMHDCLEEMHNSVTMNNNSFRLASEGIKKVIEKGGDVRTNTVLIKPNYQRIGDIIDYIYGLGVRTFNISSLNPTWASPKNNLFDKLAPKYADMEPYIEDLLCRYSDKDVRITLEGFPYCFLPEYDNYNLYNNKREIYMLSYLDKSIWNYEESLNRLKVRVKDEKCGSCNKNNICKGVWSGYVKMAGWDEFRPLPDDN